jgi:hypothetical protein
VKGIGARSLRGVGGELGKLKTLTYGSNYIAQNIYDLELAILEHTI